MKTFLIFALFGIVAGVKFQFNSTDPCVMLDVDATFNITASQRDSQLVTGSVKASDVHSVSGSCGENQAKLIINFNKTGAKWTLLFSKKNDSVTVALDMMFQFDPDKMFPNKNLTSKVIVDDEGTTTLSKSDQSYRCDASQEVKFKSFTGDNVTYTVLLTLKSLQVQAFNVSNGAFNSDVKHCEADVKSTSPSKPTSSVEPATSEATTSEEPTTSEKPDTSTESTQMTSDAPPTSDSTTTRPIPHVNHYVFSNGNDTCICMDAAIQLSIMYETKDNKTKSSEMFAVPGQVTLEGMCDTDGNASLTINFDNNNVTFEFTDISGNATIKSIMFSVVQDSVWFPDAKNPGERLQETVDPPQIATADNTFYTCQAGEHVTFSDKSEMILSSLKWQAFNLDHGNFTKQGRQCKEDMPTTLSTSTLMPTTPKPQPGPFVNNFTVSEGNTTCLVMKSALVLRIPFTDKKKENQTREITVPEVNQADITGVCGDMEESITFSFFKDWNITMVFAQDKTSSLTAPKDVKHQLSNVTINYVLDSVHFPDANKSDVKISVMAINVGQFDVSQKGSYKCNSNVTIDAENGVELVTSNFQYKAFQTGNNTAFSNDDVVECPADTETNSIVPIAVGAALAGLVVIVLIAYLIGRRKRRSGYESV